MPITFNDIFKSSFLENFNTIPLFDMVTTMLLSFILGLFIFYIYKKTYAGVMYSQAFGITLIALTMITSMLILAVTSNIVLSLGMVGALSIVRFRTAIKEPSDIAFLFWSIASGIIFAAGFFTLAVIGAVVIGIMLLVFSQYKSFEQPYIFIVHCDSKATEKKVRDYVEPKAKKLALKSKTITKDAIELNYEIRLKEDDTSFINDLYDLEGVNYTVLVSYNGDYMS